MVECNLIGLPMCNGLDAISSGGCVDWNWVSFSGETRFALGNAGVKTHKQALIGLLRAGRDRFGGGSFVVWGGKMGDEKTYFVVMQNNFNALHR